MQLTVSLLEIYTRDWPDKGIVTTVVPKWPAGEDGTEAIRSAFAALRELADRCGVEVEMEAVR